MSIRYISLIFCCIITNSHIEAQSSTKQRTLVLSLEQTRKIKVPLGCNVHINHGRSIKVIDQQSRLQLLPKREGVTLLSCGPIQYRIFVLLKKASLFFTQTQILLKNRLGLSIQYQHKQISIQGTLLRLSDWLEIVQLAHKNSTFYNFDAQIDWDLQSSIKKEFEHLAQTHHLPPAQIHFTPHLEILISSSNQNHKKIWTRILTPYGLKPQFRPDLLPNTPLIKTQIWVVEVNRKWSRQFGLQWPSSISANLTPKLGFHHPLLSSLKAAESSGKAQILSSPVLLTRSGSEAEFLAGGEFPIKIVGHRGNTRNVIWKKHGIFLKIKPTVDIQNKIRLDLKTEISTLDFSHSIEGLPSLRTNRVNTHFDLYKEQTIVISGLTQSLKGYSQSGLPWLQNIPILGPLFRSQDFNENQSELMIIVQPNIVSPSSQPPPKEIPPKMTPPIQIQPLEHLQ